MTEHHKELLPPSFVEQSARDRVKSLLDPGSCHELLTPFDRLTSPWLEKQGIVPQFDDGVVIAKGKLDGKALVVAAIDSGFQGGSIGEISGAKIAAILEKAVEENRRGNPTAAVLALDTGGVRLQEANLGMAAIAEIHSAIVELREHQPVIGLITGPVGCFGGMGIGAALCSYLIMTREGRLGLNGPQVIEQEAGIGEYDSRNRPFIWSLTGGEQRFGTQLVDALIGDSCEQVRTSLIEHLSMGNPQSFRSDNVEHFLPLLAAVDTSKQLDAAKARHILSGGKNA